MCCITPHPEFRNYKISHNNINKINNHTANFKDAGCLGKSYPHIGQVSAL